MDKPQATRTVVHMQDGLMPGSIVSVLSTHFNNKYLVCTLIEPIWYTKGYIGKTYNIQKINLCPPNLTPEEQLQYLKEYQLLKLIGVENNE